MIKSSKFIIALFYLALIITSCSDADEVAPDGTPSDDEVVEDEVVDEEVTQEDLLTNNVLLSSNTAMDRLRDQGLSGPQGVEGGIGARRSGKSPLSIMRASRSRKGRSLFCGEEGFDFSEDGSSYTYTLDFGDGCTDFGEFLKGKLVETGSFSEDGSSFSAEVEYVDFGGEDWLINGTYKMEGSVDLGDGFDEDDFGDDFPDFDFSYTFTFEIDFNEQWTENSDDTDERTIQEITYTANGTEVIDMTGYTIESQEEFTKIGEDEYTSKVDQENPLSFGLECEEALIPTKGVESGTYTIEGVSGTWSVDYGDGTCDNLVTLTENGESEEIDLIEELEALEKDIED